MPIRCTVAALLLLLVPVPVVAADGLTGPIYPMPGGAGTGHGGNVCVATQTTSDAPLGSAQGVTWTFGGGTPTSSTICPTGTSTPAPFDTERFQRLYWGVDSRSRPKIAMDGAFDQATETLTYQSTMSDPARGLLVWTGTTRMLAACQGAGCTNFADVSVVTQLEMRVTTIAQTPAPVALAAPATAGITNAPIGGVVAVTPGLRNFRVNLKMLARAFDGATLAPAKTFYDSYRHQSPSPQLRTSFTGAFWYENRAPIADFSISDQQAFVPLSFHAGYRDPDGAVTAIGWDFNDDGNFTESDRPDAQWAFPPGTYRVNFRVVDDEKPQPTTTIVTKVIEILSQDRDGDGYFPPADCVDTDARINPNAFDIPENGIDENCDGVDPIILDRDGDSYNRPLDCDDNNPAVHPGAFDVPGNALDEDCDGRPEPPKTMVASVTWSHVAGAKTTRFTALTVKDVVPGSTITASCKGKKCPKKFTIRNARGTVVLKKYLGKKFRVGNVIEIRITHDGYMGVVKTLKIRKSKAPVASTKCLPPGAKKPTKCT